MRHIYQSLQVQMRPHIHEASRVSEQKKASLAVLAIQTIHKWNVTDKNTFFRMRDGPPDCTGPPGNSDPPREWRVLNLIRPGKGCPAQMKINKKTKTDYQPRNGVYKRKLIMKTLTKNRLIGLVLAGSCSLLGTTNVLAAAGDTISNTATLGYSVGGSAQTVIESSGGAGNSTPGVGNGTATTFVEDRLVNFTITRGGATSQVVPNGTLQAVSFTLVNTGNAPQGFLLKGLNNANATADPFGGNADVFDATSVQTFVESGATAGFQAAQDTAAFVATLAPNTPLTVYVVSTIPALQSDGITPLVNGDVAVMSLVAQIAVAGSTGIAADAIVTDDNAHASPGGTGFTNGTANITAGVAGAAIADDPNAEEMVFGDIAGTQDGTGAADVASNGQHSDDSSYTVQSAALTVTKTSAALWDPVNLNANPKSFPGAYVRYTITIANAAGAANADLTTLSDALTAALALDPDFGDGTAANNPTSAAGSGIEITHVNNAVTNYCTGDVADADTDGCSYTGGAGGTISVNIATVMGANATLAAGESLTITFNAIMQ